MIDPVLELDNTLYRIFSPIFAAIIQIIEDFINGVTEIFGGFDNIRIYAWWHQYKYLRGLA